MMSVKLARHDLLFHLPTGKLKAFMNFNDCLLYFVRSFIFVKKTFCGFSKGRNQYWAGWVYDFCVYYMTGTPEGSTESGFMEKPGIEPATPGLQGIALIHYTGASLHLNNECKKSFLVRKSLG